MIFELSGVWMLCGYYFFCMGVEWGGILDLGGSIGYFVRF